MIRGMKNKGLLFCQVLFSIFIIASFFSACKTNVAPVKPEENYLPAKTVHDRELSFLTIPMTISLADIQKQINTYVTGVLYDDNSLDNNDGDGIIFKVKKYADIKLEALSSKIRLTVPLDVWGKYRTLGITTEFKG